MDNGILKLLDDVFFNTDEVKDNNDVEKLDLSKDEDYAKFNKYVDDCKKICDSDDSTSNLAKLMFEQFFGFDMNDIVDDIKKLCLNVSGCKSITATNFDIVPISTTCQIWCFCFVYFITKSCEIQINNFHVFIF